ncbi:MAG: hypothetical protein Q9M92_12160 [Enterobacterales bacterium]|nr:hypothetical protein [Enterobacterales bacterium]
MNKEQNKTAEYNQANRTQHQPTSSQRSGTSSQQRPALRDAEKVDVFEYEPAGFMSRGRW